jgi:predicted nucleic-acid-binding Zn-ribbon protein
MVENGRLTPQDKMAVNSWFNTKGVKKDCPACGHTSYGIDSQLFQAAPASAPDEAKEVIVVKCHDCGHIRTFDAKTVLARAEAK